MTIVLCTATIMAIVYSSLKDLLPYLFTGDEYANIPYQNVESIYASRENSELE